jgi:hypothetical protein
VSKKLPNVRRNDDFEKQELRDELIIMRDKLYA